MYYTIYKTTNLITNQKYIGKHVTTNPNDSYIGSGTYLRNAIKKYGKENFKKEVLFIFSSEEEMNQKEIELVNEVIVNDSTYYNVALGGQGGNIVFYEGSPIAKSTAKKISTSLTNNQKLIDAVKQAHKDKRIGMHNKQHTEEAKQKISKAHTGIPKSEESKIRHSQFMKEYVSNPEYVNPFKGKRHNVETRKKISDNHHNISGENNPMFGKNHQESTKEKLRQAAMNRPKLECPHCNKLVDMSNYTRWHGDNCKEK